MFKIDKGVPLPPRRRKGPTKYPWLTMKVNESFFTVHGNIANLRSACVQAGKRYDKKYAAREIDGGVRVSRVK